QIRVVGTAGFLHEDPAGGRVGLVDESVIAQRRDGETGENVLVDGALDEGDGSRTPFGDHGGAALTGAAEPVYTALPLADPQRRDRHRLGMWMQLAPDAHRRMALEIRPRLA